MTFMPRLVMVRLVLALFALVLRAALLEDDSTDCRFNTYVERTWGCEH
jgi:hypothetical protein